MPASGWHGSSHPRSGAHTVRNASLGERRPARIDGYAPATAPMTWAAGDAI